MTYDFFEEERVAGLWEPEFVTTPTGTYQVAVVIDDLPKAAFIETIVPNAVKFHFEETLERRFEERLMWRSLINGERRVP